MEISEILSIPKEKWFFHRLTFFTSANNLLVTAQRHERLITITVIKNVKSKKESRTILTFGQVNPLFETIENHFSEVSSVYKKRRGKYL